MAYGQGENELVIDRPSASGGDKVQMSFSKVNAQLDALYAQLNADIVPATENTRGLVRIASQHEVNLGLADATAVTPLALRNSQLAADAAAAKAAASANAASIGALENEVEAVRSVAVSAQETAQQALNAVQGGGSGGAPGAPAMPTEETFMAMPPLTVKAIPVYEGSANTVNYCVVELPPGGLWAYCGHVTFAKTNGDSGLFDDSADICGLSAGGTVVWRHVANVSAGGGTSGFIWKVS
ncbi:MAG: hypothetical protein Q4C86_14155 [bacterium]|nr:hypothetical protein [bacterium]